MKSAIQYIFKTFFLSLCIIANTSFAFAQTAAILPPAKTTFFDQNGHPLTGGKVNFYIPSTTTPKTTWQDQAETIPNTNPVVLDSAGRAIILGSGNYRQVVYDKYGNLIWDQVTSSNGTGGGTTPTSVGDGSQVGTIREWAGFTAPTNYLFTYGQAVSRTTYSALFSAITSTQSVFCNAGNPQLTGLTDTTNFWIGMSVEVSCVASGSSTIVSKTSTTVNLAVNPNVTTNTSATFFPWGNGDASSTFNLPDLRGQVLAGNNNMGGTASSNLTTTYFGSQNPNSIGASGGSQSATLATANLPAYTPAGTITNGAITSTFSSQQAGLGPAGGSQAFTSGSAASTAVSGTVTSTQATSTFAGVAQGGTDTAFSLVQPTKTINYIIKVIPDVNLSVSGVVTSIGGLSGAFTCSGIIVCTGNTIYATGGGGGGGVSTVSVVTANGLSGTVANPTTAPAITLGTTVTGIVKANSGAFTGATAGIDYQAPIALTTLGSSGAATLSGSTLNIPQYSGGGSGGTAFKQNFIAGTDFTTGSTTSLTLSTLPSSGQAVLISFDGVEQTGGTVPTTGGVCTSPDTWCINVSTGVITFSTAITAINVVQVVGLSSSGGGGGTGTVTNTSVATANGFYGSVATSTTTPVITINTNVSGIIKGTGSAMTAATAGTDYQAPITLTTSGTSGAATFSGGTLNIPNYATSSGTGIYGNIVNAVADTTYCNVAGAIDPTGATDSTAGINNCLAHYSAVSLPKGTYKIALSGGVNAISNGALIGAGMGVTTLSQSTASGCVITISTGVSNFTMQGLNLDRSVTATSGGNGTCTTFGSVNNVTLRDIFVQNQWVGLALPSAYLATMENIWSNYNYSDGYYFSVPSAGGGAFQWQLSNVNAGQNGNWGFEVVAPVITPSGAAYVPAAYMNNITTFANCSGGMNFYGSGATTGTINDIKLTNYSGSGNGGIDLNFTTYGEHNIIMNGLVEGAGMGSGGLCGRFYYSTATSSWTTSTSILNVGSVPSSVTAGMKILDNNNGFIIGTVSSYTSSTITLTAPAAHASSTSADLLSIAQGSSGAGYGVLVGTNNVEVTVSGFQIRGVANSGIATTGIVNSLILSNNSISDNNQANTSGDSGIFISGTSLTSIAIMGNSGEGGGLQKYGLYVASGATGTVTAVGNVFNGNITGGCAGTFNKVGNIGQGVAGGSGC